MIQAIGDNIFVQRLEEEKTSNGLIIPTEKGKPWLGKVVSVGGAVDEILDLEDAVLVPAYAGSPFKFEGEEYVSLREKEIIGVVKNDYSGN